MATSFAWICVIICVVAIFLALRVLADSKEMKKKSDEDHISIE